MGFPPPPTGLRCNLRHDWLSLHLLFILFAADGHCYSPEGCQLDLFQVLKESVPFSVYRPLGNKGCLPNSQNKPHGNGIELHCTEP